MTIRSEKELREWAGRFRRIGKVVGPLNDEMKTKLEGVAEILEWSAGDELPWRMDGIWKHVADMDSKWSLLDHLIQFNEEHSAAQSLTDSTAKP